MASQQLYTAAPLTPRNPELVDINAFLGIGESDILATGLAAVDGEIYNLLTTPIGADEMEPEFGATFLTRVFDPTDRTTQAQIKFDVFLVVKRWIPGVIVDLDNSVVLMGLRSFSLKAAYSVVGIGVSGSVQVDYALNPYSN